MTVEACPCTSGKSYAECCQPYHEGKAKPPTAEALMRSRYSAFAKGEIDYIKNTLDAKGKKTFDRKAITDWSRNATWQKLEIHETEKGQSGDTDGIVEFTAHFELDGKPVAHRERSLFKVIDGAWTFIDTVDAIKKPVVRENVPGRNDPCHCGSGKKYKKCHGLAA